uniref:Uncharacterized protein n=1 Tax=Arundo donax TaxID=35708 RepID=A0A0A9C0B6_ARUDO
MPLMPLGWSSVVFGLRLGRTWPGWVTPRRIRGRREYPSGVWPC